MKKTSADHIQDAARAHAQICLLSSIVNIANSSDMGDSYNAVKGIIRTAQGQQQKLQRRYDASVAAATR